MKTRPCIVLRYGDDEFGYQLWNLAEKKVIRSRDIVFLEDKTIADWELKKKISTSESKNIDRLDELRIHPEGSRMATENRGEPAGFGQVTRMTKV